MLVNLKQNLVLHCNEVLKQKLNDIHQQIIDLQIDTQNENKSTAGDKHETALAMLHLEQEKLNFQLLESKKNFNFFNSLNFETKNRVEAGSLIELKTGLFLISVGLGKLNLPSANQPVFAISQVSPFATAMWQKTAGESFSFNQQTFTILSIA